MDSNFKQLLDSHAELRAALLVAIRTLDVKQQQYGRPRRDPVLALLRKVGREARAVAKATHSGGS